jgi:endonuclease/exonuclease/phosphatase family metal-dependent hydrolase
MNRENAIDLRVMSFNVYGCVDADRKVNVRKITQIIDGVAPDVVALQEVDAERQFDGSRNQARIIADTLGLDFRYVPLEKAGRHAFGLAILSRFALERSEFKSLPNLHSSLKMRKRGALRAVLKAPGGKIHFINTHLSVFKIERYLQLRAITKWCDLSKSPLDKPLIFCGDLNAKPGSLSYRRIASHLSDVQKAPNRSVRPEPTFPSKVPTFRIDHIFVSHHCQIMHSEVIRNPLTINASDHLPLIADLKVSSSG